jgi:hypothetical protein
VDEEFGELQTQFTFFMQTKYRKIIKQNHGGKYMGFCGFGWNRCNWGCGDRGGVVAAVATETGVKKNNRA